MKAQQAPDKDSTTAAGYRVIDASDIAQQPFQEFAGTVLEGLSERPKRLPSRYIYDDRGSHYFQQIMSLPEYYPTRCEAEILSTHARVILERFADRPLNLVDLGAGDGQKTLLLLRELAEVNAESSFVPIDISAGAMESLIQIVRGQVADIRVEGLVADYHTALRWLSTHSQEQRNLVLFLGSNLGNFNRSQSRTFLRQLWSALNPDDCVLVGFDLKKDIDVLLGAYNDPSGVTAAFNLNLLGRINRELGGNFDPSKFRHYATYDVFSGAIESYLVSLEQQTVAIEAVHSEFEFNAWEPIHTEYSYKYLPSDIEALAKKTGFVIEESFYDSNGWFCDSLWRVDKSPPPSID